MVDFQAMVAITTAVLVVVFVPGLVWVTVIAGLYQLTREVVRERRTALDELHRTV